MPLAVDCAHRHELSEHSCQRGGVMDNISGASGSRNGNQGSRNSNHTGSVTGTVPGKPSNRNYAGNLVWGKGFGPPLGRPESLLLRPMFRSRHKNFGVDTGSRFGI